MPPTLPQSTPALRNKPLLPVSNRGREMIRRLLHCK
nr:MAG TPA: hypothetical protein [Caudoviricetes sp.]